MRGAGLEATSQRFVGVSLRARFRTRLAGLDHALPAMQLWHKAKKLGVWDPCDIDLLHDTRDWALLPEPERDVLLRLTALFEAGGEGIARDLLPLIAVMADEQRLEEELYLTSFLLEEAKHFEMFRRFLDEVAKESGDLSRYHTPSWQRIFLGELPRATRRLKECGSPEAQAEASVTYNMVVEGVLAATGYYAYQTTLVRNGILPGMQQALAHLLLDESRHLAYGVFLLSRLVAEHGEGVWLAIERRMGELLEPALGVITEAFAAYPVMPFGLDVAEFTEFATAQFRTRLARIEQARGKSVADISAAPV